MDAHFWHYKYDPQKNDQRWGESIYTDFINFHSPALKICVEISDDEQAQKIKGILEEYDCVRFSDGFWYKFTKRNATKRQALDVIARAYGLDLLGIIAFGDDYADIEMLEASGLGVAMGNAIPEVKAISDYMIGSNDEDGIANFLLDLLEGSIARVNQ